mgnify:FL=1
MATETTYQYVGESPEIQARKLGAIDLAKSLTAEAPTGGLPAFSVADRSDLTSTAQDLARQGIGGYQPYIDQGYGDVRTGIGTLGTADDLIAQSLAGYAPIQQGALQTTQQGVDALAGTMGAYDPQSYQNYMNPYEDAVINQAMSDVQRASDIAGRGEAAQAVGAGAFGGARSGIVAAERGRNTLDEQARIAGQLRAQGYGQAQNMASNAFESEMRRRQGAAGQYGSLGASLGGIGSTGAQIGLGGAGQYGSLGTQYGSLGGQSAGMGELGQRLGYTDINALDQLGKDDFAYNQAVVDADRATKMQTINEPMQRLGFYSDILRGAPTTQMSFTQQTTPNPTMLNQLVGGGISALGIGSAASKSGII